MEQNLIYARNRPDHRPFAQSRYINTDRRQFRLFPLLSIMSIAVGCGLAELLIPENSYSANGALFASSVAMSAGLLGGVLIGGLSNPASVLRTESILSLGLIYHVMLDPIQGSYGLWGVSLAAVQNAFFGTAIFASSMWIGGAMGLAMRRESRSSLDWQPTPRLVFRIGIIVFIAGLLKPLIACRFSPVCLGQGLFTTWKEVPWITYRVTDSGFGFNTMLTYLGFLGFVSLPIAVVMRHLVGRMSSRVVVLWCFAVIQLLLIVQTGARRMVGLTVASAALVWILLEPRIGFPRLLRLALMALGLVVLLEMIGSWRTIGIGTALATGESMSDHHRGVIFVDENFYYLTHAMTVVPERHPYKTVDGLLWAIAGPIPRSVWPSKPTNRGVDMVKILGLRRGPGYSWSCSAVGDLYLIRGLGAIAVGGLIFGLLAAACNHFLFKPPTVHSRMLYGFGVMSLFIGLRTIRDLTAVGLFLMLLLFILFGIRRFHGAWNKVSSAGSKHDAR